jgi:quercetin dioxygenase-like cupin family protein
MQPPQGTPDVRKDLFGGHGAVKVWSLLRGPAAPVTAVLYSELAPGGTVGKHVQQEFPEIVIGLEGRGEAHVDDGPHALEGHSVVHLPLGSVLSIANLSDTVPLRYLIIKARP